MYTMAYMSLTNVGCLLQAISQLLHVSNSASLTL